MSLFGTINPNVDGSGGSALSPWMQAQNPHAVKPESLDDFEGSFSDADSGPSRGSHSIMRVVDRRAETLARRFTVQSTSLTVQEILENPFIGVSKDSNLNPLGPNFNPRAWIKNLLAIQSRDPERYPQRTAGVSFRNLGVHGFGSPTDYQKDVINSVLSMSGLMRRWSGSGKQKIQILEGFDGLVESGEMLVVLGRPGSGCSTLLKTIAGETSGLVVESQGFINYQGISAKQMHGQFRGETIYTAETDVHFPQLTVGQTLSFAARARTPRNRIPGVSRDQYARHMKDFIMAVFGLTHTMNTKVGNDFVRGVSGGERKRVSIAEAALSGSPLQCWDNSTRGLDSANAIEFCKTLKMGTELLGATACVAIYQAPQTAYDLFDKVIVLYEGREIYFGRTEDAKAYFIDLGFHCLERQTTSDFLTAVTSAEERIARSGFESTIPQTPEEFEAVWQNSSAHKKLIQDIEAYNERFPIDGDSASKFLASRRAQQAKQTRPKSPYTISMMQQIGLCMARGFERLRGDMGFFYSGIVGNLVMAVIIGTVFFDLQPDTASFYSRTALLFFAVIVNAFSSVLEILTLYSQRAIVEKHSRYALYHPFSEAVASMICDLPYKVTNTLVFNVILYFMTNLRREPQAFFIFMLFSFATTLTMSMIFRTVGASSRTLAQALAPAGIIILGLIIYTGFAIPTRDMLSWSRWINYIDPIGYTFESLMVNEFSGRNFSCSVFIPSGGPYDQTPADSRMCFTVGSALGTDVVNGDAYLATSFEYSINHLWRNLGINFGFMLFFCAAYLLATEYISEGKSKGEVLIFRRGLGPPNLSIASRDEEKSVKATNRPVSALQRMESAKFEQAHGMIQPQTAIFHWKDVCYDIKIKGEERRILDHVDGWVKPGTCTALMGVSGAGKTSLLDVLASRVTLGVVSGEILVDGRLRDSSFQRKTGYVQQQDLHLATSTVREALAFSAILRQSASIPRQEKLDYVEEVIKLLDMEVYADAVIGVPGEGLNVEQRKRLTIGVELVARPQLLLFLDEPTSGLDSQTSWSILSLLETLTKHGQAILCTIHQPSAILFQRFDRLLFLASGGKTVYFGEIGHQSSILTDYFVRNGAKPCPAEANPAEWMLEVIGAAPGSHTEIDWNDVWRRSPEIKAVHLHLEELNAELSVVETSATSGNDPSEHNEFAAPFTLQMWEAGKRVFSQYWRTPSYLYSKTALCSLTALFIGFSFFRAENSEQGLQNQVFAIFLLLIIFGNLVQQIMPNFVTQRALYEARERPAKIYSWQTFMYVNIIVEVAWNSLMAVIVYFCWFYPIGLYRNAIPTDTVFERSGLMFLYIWFFLLFTSTFALMMIAGLEQAETGGNLANILFSLTLIFCGVLATPAQLPRFWIFMYRISPFTYLVAGMLATGVANTNVQCSDIELLTFNPSPAGSTCAEYLGLYIDFVGGYLMNPDATDACKFCPLSETNTFLTAVNSYYDERWRNLGIMAAYIVLNVFVALGIYWLVRMPKRQRGGRNTVKGGRKQKAWRNRWWGGAKVES